MTPKSATRCALLIISLLGLTAVGVTPSGAAAPPPASGPRIWSGRSAVRHAGTRLPGIAARHGRTATALEAEFVHDPTLYLDSTDHLFYIDPAAPDTSASAPEQAGFDPGPNTFLLHSNPGAQRVIYLDFHGATLSGTAWNTDFLLGGDCDTDPYDTDGTPATFSAPERETVYGIWQRVSEDYAPFAIDVTTEDPGAAAIDRAGGGDLQYGTRALITKSVSTCPNTETLFESVCNSACGGIAYTNVFDESAMHAYYQPALIFQNGVPTEKSEAEAVSHEVGHNLGLHHDGATSGCSGPCSYYAGHGSWAPLMGVSYSKAITQWSQGEYSLANNTEDDFAVMQSHGADLLTDDHGDTRPAATTLTGPTLSGAGTITTRTDVDVFGITVTGGAAVITASPAPTSPNLDIRLELRDGSDTLITASDPPSGSTGSDTATGLERDDHPGAHGGHVLPLGRRRRHRRRRYRLLGLRKRRRLHDQRRGRPTPSLGVSRRHGPDRRQGRQEDQRRVHGQPVGAAALDHEGDLHDRGRERVGRFRLHHEVGNGEHRRR